MSEPARAVIAAKSRQLEELALLEAAWQQADLARSRISELKLSVLAAQEAKKQADSAYASIVATSEPTSSNVLAQQARDLTLLVTLGRRLGLHNGCCPLCASDQTSEEFANGLALAESIARELDGQAVEQAEREQSIEAAAASAEAARRELEQRERFLQDSQNTVSEFERRLAGAGLPSGASIDELRGDQLALHAGLNAAREDLRILETLKLNAGLVKTIHEEGESRRVYARAQEKLGLVRRAESRAKALHDAARRAANETLNQRLERVLPLMAELYRRLRPHPVWSEIEYKIRGDVRRFLKLQVGGDLNPQFIFSSGQRRATGLAFLLKSKPPALPGRLSKFDSSGGWGTRWRCRPKPGDLVGGVIESINSGGGRLPIRKIQQNCDKGCRL